MSYAHASGHNPTAISIIVPCLHDQKRFEDTLAAVLRNQPPAAQIIVPHGPGFCDVHDLAAEVDFLPVNFLPIDWRPAKPASQLQTLLAASVAVSSSPVVNVVRPGVEVQEDWCLRPLEVLRDNVDTVAVSLPIGQAQNSSRSVAAGIGVPASGDSKRHAERPVANGRPRLPNVSGPSSWCGFYRTDFLRSLFAAEFATAPLTDSAFDVNMSLLIAASGYSHQVLTTCTVLSDIDFPYDQSTCTTHDWLRMQQRFGKQLPRHRSGGWVARARSFLSARTVSRFRRDDRKYVDRFRQSLESPQPNQPAAGPDYQRAA